LEARIRSNVVGSEADRIGKKVSQNRVVVELENEDQQDATREMKLKISSELEQLSLTTSNRRTFCEETRESSNYFRVAAGNGRKRQNSQE
jgi:hypothetical protein